MKKQLVALFSFLLAFTTLNAQNEIDALRYSRLSPTGTARYVGTGGAFGALGGDFTTLSNNPAGIGLYKSSEFTITPSLFFGKTESTYFNEWNEDDKYNFNLGNIGVVIATDPTKKKPETQWRNIQFGIGVNRLANFHSRAIIDGFNETSSFLTPYLDYAQGLNPNDLDNFSTGLAYDAYLLWLDDNGNYQIDMPFGGVRQRKIMETSGSINEMVLSIGGNYMDRLYLGATVGVPYVRYKENTLYTETDEENRNDYFGSFTRSDELITEGTGVNLKLGAIFRATDWFRIGGAIETPTFYTLTDTYSTTFRGSFDTDTATRASADGFYEYELNTPFKASAGVGFIIGKSGLISADYQMVDYANAKLRASDYDFGGENKNIKDSYVKTHNIKIGTEWRFGTLNVRGGYSISDNPYRYGTNSTMNTYSAGIGIREKRFFVDFAWAMNDMDDEHQLYSAPFDADAATAFTKINNNMFLMTLGIRF